MNALRTFFEAGVLDAPWAERVGWVLLHSLWQIALIAGFHALFGMLLRKRSAQARYLCGCVAMVAMLASSVATYVLLPEGDRSGAKEPALAATVVKASGGAVASVEPGVALPVEIAVDPGMLPPEVKIEAEVVSAAAETELSESAPGVLSTVQRWLPWATVVWLVGVILLSLRPVVGWLHVLGLQRRGLSPLPDSPRQAGAKLQHRLGVTRAVRFMESALVEVPTVVGALRPMVLLPAAVVSGLSIAQVEMILAHELAHVRRHDYLVNLAQTVIEALLFFHPAVWWVSAQVRRERENCCDDIAVAVSGNREHYVQALTRLEEQRAASSVAVLAATGGSLLERVRRLLGQPGAEFGYRSASAWLAGLVAVGLVSLALATGDAPREKAENGSADEVGQEDAAPAPIEHEAVMVVSDREAMLAYARALAAGDLETLGQTWEFQDDLDRQFAEKLAGMFARAVEMRVDLVSMERLDESSLFACFLLHDAPEITGKGPQFVMFHRKNGEWRCFSPLGIRTLVNARAMGAEQMGRRAIAQKMAQLRFARRDGNGSMATMKAERDAFARLARPPYGLAGFERVAEQMQAAIEKVEAEQGRSWQELWRLMLEEHGEEALPRPGDFSLSFYLPADPADPHARKLPFPGPEETFLAEPFPCLTDDAVREARVEPTPDGKQARIELLFTSGGARLLEAITRESIRKRLAIVVDGKVLAAPEIMMAIDTGKVMIEGSFTRQEAEAIVEKLNSFRKEARKLIEEVGKEQRGGDQGAAEEKADGQASVNRIVEELMGLRHKHPELVRFAEDARHEVKFLDGAIRVSLAYEHNYDGGTKTKAAGPGDASQPWCRIALDIRPLDAVPTQLESDPLGADEAIQWNGESDVRRYRLAGSRLFAVVSVQTGSDALRGEVNRIIDRELNALIAEADKIEGVTGKARPGGPGGLEFLEGIPDFRELSLQMTEAQLPGIIRRHSLAVTRDDSGDYHLFTRNGENVIVMFRGGECGIQRMRPDRETAERLFLAQGKAPDFGKPLPPPEFSGVTGLTEGENPDNPLGLDNETLIRLFNTGKLLRAAAQECVAYQAKHTKVPESTEVLFEDYQQFAKDMIVDPFAAEGGVLRLTKRMDGPDDNWLQVWSVGPDGDWDGGKPIDAAGPTLNGDLGAEMRIGKWAFNWQAGDTMAMHMDGKRLSHYLAAQGPEHPGAINPHQTLDWGSVVDGLCMAVKLVPQKESYTLGEKIGLEFHVRNVSRHPITIAGFSWRQDAGPDCFVIRNDQGEQLTVGHTWFSGWTPIQRETLKTGAVAVFKSSALAFLAQGMPEPGHPVGHTVVTTAGRHTLQCNLIFPDGGSSGPDGMPRHTDWQGTLQTPVADVTVVAQDEADETKDEEGKEQAAAAAVEARKRFIEVERFARRPKAEQAEGLVDFYKNLDFRSISPMIEAILSSYPSNILDRDPQNASYDGNTEQWAQQLAAAAEELSVEQVVDKLKSPLWLNIATRARALQVLREHKDDVIKLIDSDLKQSEGGAVSRKATTLIAALDLRGFNQRLLGMYLAADDPSSAVLGALLTMKDPAILPVLLEKVKDEPESLLRISALLPGQLAGEPAPQVLLELLDSPDADIRYHAAYALQECRDPALAEPAVTLAGEKQARFREMAALWTAKLPEKAFLEVRTDLLPLLHDEDEEVRFAALRSFGQRRDPAAGPVILEMLKNGVSDQEASVVLQAMGRLCGDDWNPSIHHYWWHYPPDGDRAAVKKAIKSFDQWLKSRPEWREPQASVPEIIEKSWAVTPHPDHRLAHGWVTFREEQGELVIEEHVGGGASADPVNEPLDLGLDVWTEDSLMHAVMSKRSEHDKMSMHCRTNQPQGTELRERRLPPTTDLTTDYQVLWMGDLGKDNEIVKRAAFVARLSPVNESYSGFVADEMPGVIAAIRLADALAPGKSGGEFDRGVSSRRTGIDPLASGESASTKELQLTVSAADDGDAVSYELDGKPVELTALPDLLKQKREQTPDVALTILADSELPLAAIARAVKAAETAEVENVTAQRKGGRVPAETEEWPILADGIYRVRGFDSNKPGTEVKRSDYDGSVVLLEKLTSELGEVAITSQANDNSRFRIDLKGAGPFEPEDEEGHFALVVDNSCVMLGSHSDPDDNRKMNFAGWQIEHTAAEKMAAKLAVTPALRRHPGHKMDVRFSSAKPTFSPGDPVIVTMTIENTGDQPFSFMDGGKQRGPRNNQFGFTAFRDAGKGEEVPDTGDATNFGGRAGFITLKPGEAFEKEVDITKWFDLSEPGTYLIRGHFEMVINDNWDEIAKGSTMVTVTAEG